MKFERNVTKRSLKIFTVMDIVILSFYCIWIWLLSYKVFPNTGRVLLCGASLIILIIVKVIIEIIKMDMIIRRDCNFAYTINLENDEIVITDDKGETKRIGRDFVIVGRFAGTYKILLRIQEGSDMSRVICYNRKLLKYLKEINPNCMGKRLKKLK